ncbi:hypothetical protein [Streptococcus suis]
MNGNTATNAFTEVMGLFQKGLAAGAIVLIVLGALDIGTNLGESGNRIAVLNGIYKIIGGAIVGAAALLLNNVSI